MHLNWIYHRRVWKCLNGFIKNILENVVLKIVQKKIEWKYVKYLSYAACRFQSSCFEKNEFDAKLVNKKIEFLHFFLFQYFFLTLTVLHLEATFPSMVLITSIGRILLFRAWRYRECSHTWLFLLEWSSRDNTHQLINDFHISVYSLQNVIYVSHGHSNASIAHHLLIQEHSSLN